MEDQAEGSIWSELKLFGRLAGPSVVIQVVFLLRWAYSTMFVGSTLGTDYLTGLSLANLSGNLSGLSVIIGFQTAVDTLAPQAFARKRFEEVGFIALRGFVGSLILLLPMVAVWQNIDVILVFFHQPEEPAQLAKRFLGVHMFTYPALAFNEAVFRFYRSQNVIVPFLVIYGFALIVHPMFIHLWLENLGLGFDGVPLAHASSSYGVALCNVLLLRYSTFHHHLTVPVQVDLPYLRRALLDRDGVWMVASLGFPGILSMSEWWFWEGICFLSGEFGTQSLAAHSIAYTLVPLCYMVPHGFGGGISTRVGALLAQGHVTVAKRLTFYTSNLCVMIICFNAFLIYIFRDNLVQLFTADLQVIDLCEKIWPYVAWFIVLDGFLGVIRGVVQALALQERLSRIVLVSLFILGLPSMYYLAVVRKQGLVGIWIMMPITYSIMNALLCFICISKDWDAYSQEVQSKFGTNVKRKVSDMVMH